MPGVDHLLDGALGDELSHPVIYPSTGKDDLWYVTHLLSLMGKIIWINTDAVASDKAGLEIKEVPFLQATSSISICIHPHPNQR